MIRYLIILTLLASCATLKQNKDYKAYQRVAADAYVDQRESVLLAQKCLSVYPFKTDSPRVVNTTLDSSAYQATIDGLLMMIDSLAAQLDNDELAFIDTNDVVRIRAQDSLRIIRKFIKTYRVPPVVQTVIKEVPVADTRLDAINQAQLAACTAERAKAYALVEQEEAKSARLRNRNQKFTGYAIAGGLFLLIGGFITGRVMKRTTLI